VLGADQSAIARFRFRAVIDIAIVASLSVLQYLAA